MGECLDGRRPPTPPLLGSAAGSYENLDMTNDADLAEKELGSEDEETSYVASSAGGVATPPDSMEVEEADL